MLFDACPRTRSGRGWRITDERTGIGSHRDGELASSAGNQRTTERRYRREMLRLVSHPWMIDQVVERGACVKSLLDGYTEEGGGESEAERDI